MPASAAFVLLRKHRVLTRTLARHLAAAVPPYPGLPFDSASVIDVRSFLAACALPPPSPEPAEALRIIALDAARRPGPSPRPFLEFQLFGPPAFHGCLGAWPFDASDPADPWNAWERDALFWLFSRLSVPVAAAFHHAPPLPHIHALAIGIDPATGRGGWAGAAPRFGPPRSGTGRGLLHAMQASYASAVGLPPGRMPRGV